VQQARQRLKPGRPLGRPPQPFPQCAQERIAKTLALQIVSEGKMTQVSGERDGREMAKSNRAACEF
jgi:hypothetical protein